MVKSISSREIIAKLEAAGFEVARQKGSHLIMRHPDGRRAVVNHPVKDMRLGTVASIERETKIKLR